MMMMMMMIVMMMMIFSSKYYNCKCYKSLYCTGQRIVVIGRGKVIVPIHTTKKNKKMYSSTAS